MTPTPNFSHALGWLNGDDIAPDPKVDPRKGAQDEALLRRARLFRSVFGSQDGELVLQTILEATLFRSPVDHRLSGEEYLRYAQMREGQNQAAALILTYLDMAAKEDSGHGRGPRGDGRRDDAGGGAGDYGLDGRGNDIDIGVR